MSELDHLTLQEAAKRNSLSVSFLRRHLRNPPRLPHLRAGRKILISRIALSRWLAEFQDREADATAAAMARVRRDFPEVRGG